MSPTLGARLAGGSDGGVSIDIQYLAILTKVVNRKLGQIMPLSDLLAVWSVLSCRYWVGRWQNGNMLDRHADRHSI